MAMKLYYGGFSDYKEFVVADSEEQAIFKIGVKLNTPFLPITAEEIQNIDGYQIHVSAWNVSDATNLNEKPTETYNETEIVDTNKIEENTIRHCKKCDFTCDNQGALLQHYRDKHPKGD